MTAKGVPLCIVRSRGSFYGLEAQLAGVRRRTPLCDNGMNVAIRWRSGVLRIEVGGRGDIEVGGRGRALHKAAAVGDLDAVKREIDDGDDPDFQDQNGQRPLHYAATQGRLEVAQWLVSVGADADAADDSGKRPIELAQQAGHAAVVTLLEQMGARVQ